MHDPREPHLAALKWVLRYVRGTLDYGLQLRVSSTSQLNAYTDVDWAGCLVTLSRSSAEAEYRGVANVVRVLHVPSRYQYADIFTKGLPFALFGEFRTSLSVRASPTQTAGGVLNESINQFNNICLNFHMSVRLNLLFIYLYFDMFESVCLPESALVHLRICVALPECVCLHESALVHLRICVALL
ncbi:ribonuclease H-like domain-containing protein [Tanacetum coccineum]